MKSRPMAQRTAVSEDRRIMSRLLCLLLIAALALPPAFSPAVADTRPAPEDRGASGLALALRRLQTIASALHTAAHPDDESTELLAYLARGQGARVAYLSLNRGEGGQNGIGPELGESLGVLRTEELLAARKLDGAEQYFTRAYDFGFTRSVPETLQKWNKEEVLGDMVRVIRTLRPLVLVNGFSGTARDGHGQHQLAGLLAPEAVTAAADANRFPEQIKEGLQPWQVLKLYQRVFEQGKTPVATFDVGQFDPVLGRSHSELAAEGRSKHRSQDFGMIQMRGSSVRSFWRQESRVAAPDKESSLFEGIDVSVTGIAHFAGSSLGAKQLLTPLARIKELAAQALAEHRPEEPQRIAPKLAEGLREVRALRQQLGALDAPSRATVDAMLARKESEFADALTRAHGVVVDALSSAEVVAPGETLEVSANVYLAGQPSFNRETAERMRDLKPQANAQITLTAPTRWRVEPTEIEADQPAAPSPFFRGREKADAAARFRVRVPDDEPPTEPYWLARPRTREQFDWDKTMPVTLPFAPPRLSARVELTLDGERVTVNQPVEFRYANQTFGEIRRELKVAPALTLTLRPSLLVIPQSGPQPAPTNAAVRRSGSARANDDARTREVSVEVTHNARRATNGSLELVAPPGWRVEGEAQPLAFTRQGEKTSRRFRVTPPANAGGTFTLKAVATADGRDYARGYTTVAYPHVETHFIYHPAEVKAEVFDVKVAAGLRVGYVPGSGDDTVEALKQLGVSVKTIDEAELASGDLSVYDTIILGIRVYEVRDDVVANNKRLLDYVANGGTLVVQYNKHEFVTRGQFAPYPVKMGDGSRFGNNLRVTDETAPVKVLVPDHPLFNFPNKITDADWKGWAQERGLYFLSEWDAKYTPLLSAPDDTGRPLQGGQLIAEYGKGRYVFTGYAWFRQLPAGVPGAYRLFANLISLPKSKKQ
jgi:LmbE family N-acetylglucosaminyl deacetylase